MLKDVFQFFKGYPINNNITNCCSSMVKSSYCLILIKNCICKQWFKLVQWFPRGRFFLKFTDGRRGTPSEAIAHLAFWPGVLKIDPDRCPESDIILTRQK